MKWQYGVFLVVVVIALFLNPKELYVSYKGEKDVLSISMRLLEVIGHEDEDIVAVNHYAGDIFSLETDTNYYLIERKRVSRNYFEYQIYLGHEITVGRFGGH